MQPLGSAQRGPRAGPPESVLPPRVILYATPPPLSTPLIAGACVCGSLSPLQPVQPPLPRPGTPSSGAPPGLEDSSARGRPRLPPDAEPLWGGCFLAPLSDSVAPAKAQQGCPQHSPPGRSRHGRRAAHLHLSPGTPAKPAGRQLSSRPSAGATWRAGRGGGRAGGGEGEGPPSSTQAPPRAHTNGHEVPKGDKVPQVVKVAVAEEELGTPQKRRPVLGPRRVLQRETHAQTLVPAAAWRPWEPTKVRAPIPALSPLPVHPAQGSHVKQRNGFMHKEGVRASSGRPGPSSALQASRQASRESPADTTEQTLSREPTRPSRFSRPGCRTRRRAGPQQIRPTTAAKSCLPGPANLLQESSSRKALLPDCHLRISVTVSAKSALTAWT